MPIPDISIQDQFGWFGPQKLGIFLRGEIRISTSRTLRFFSTEYSWSSDSGSCFRKAQRGARNCDQTNGLKGRIFEVFQSFGSFLATWERTFDYYFIRYQVRTFFLLFCFVAIKFFLQLLSNLSASVHYAVRYRMRATGVWNWDLKSVWNNAGYSALMNQSVLLTTWGSMT